MLSPSQVLSDAFFSAFGARGFYLQHRPALPHGYDYCRTAITDNRQEEERRGRAKSMSEQLRLRYRDHLMSLSSLQRLLTVQTTVRAPGLQGSLGDPGRLIYQS